MWSTASVLLLALAGCAGTGAVQCRAPAADSLRLSPARRSEPVSVWRELPIGPGSVASYDEFATHPASVAFRVEIDAAGP